MAIVKACNITNSVNNTGKQCDSAMVATAMLIAIDPAVEIDEDTDLDDPVDWLTNLIHAKQAWPIFGQNAPIREINNDQSGDQIVELDDGLKVFLRYGLYNRTFSTTSGGLCYAEALQSFLNSGKYIVEIDQQGQMLLCKKVTSPGKFRGLIAEYMMAPAPVLADFKSTPYKNRFMYCFSPTELVTNGVIFKGASALLSMMGLIDSKITKAAAATTTKLKIGVETTCSEDDLVAKFGAALGTHVNNFKVQDVAALGTPVVPSSAAIVTGWIELTGVYTTGHTYRVWGATPAAWLANAVEGYDASENFVDIIIP